ncbi:MAG: hypothetical protein A2312_00260 [Candidatus Staskawiczbacteria bacterium RIFOXYB2_FULL_32_9]|uniref:DUF1858 domain-containing protein n=1 Tax=Candidatus Staskawiczbacteria bacterium RIFOXYD1_FULL_32_13 TaxID=1802234 RepID=A0A1G2JJW1_9BACT|nr:MAG: hypothetical protein UR22_C0017G0019 [Parcubacteria group bacterium GW2011_GWC2_32_10]OGZ79490.1 MAG: hypothetical protein A2360_02170 [Candidatus Staskawiczbacteria bacterium RIFOXYB1_FULL_32_11]OGZ79560.1 MAG: hypothetical protein A2256_00900 [Candidatus Staskawiczbacteria bacterium RIFOXYA2_FULL_32_7]OGZ84858.1 MAG: hypothetical protein A2312_00260 [Candidatus Staskawiczbacteria bacterium RIFOXYB2_FULL_32_9]OGZ85439.1 MAG: hypothetical protein A2463_04305 [Candidatus Staskawiczbacter
MKNKITKNIPIAKQSRIHDADKIGIGTTLEKIMEKSGSEEILSKHSVPCLSCPMAKFEMTELKIGDVCKMYGINVEKLLKDLNKN